MSLQSGTSLALVGDKEVLISIRFLVTGLKKRTYAWQTDLLLATFGAAHKLSGELPELTLSSSPWSVKGTAESDWSSVR